MMNCGEGDCTDPIYENPIVIPPLPSSDGGGHEFVTELPDAGAPGVEYVVMGDPRDCSSFKGSYVWNTTGKCWVTTSGAGGGALDSYTFEKTTTGWVAKKNGKVIFTYNDERITQLITDVTNIDNRVTKVEGDITNLTTQVTTNTTNININKTDITNIKNDIYGDYLKNRIAVCEDGPLTLTVDETNPQAKKLIICMDETKVGDKSDGAYQIKGQLSTYLSTSLLGTTPVNIVNVPDLDPDDIVLGETYLYDNQGTMGVVKAYDKTTGIMTVTTMTTSPGERSGVRLGSVELATDLPASITAAEGLGWLTPVEGDFAYVRDDDGKLAEYLVQSIDGSGNITWAFSHYINAGNYVVDILTEKGVLIPKNADGTVTLPVNDRIKTIYLADGTALPVDANYAVTLPDFIKGAVLKDGTVLPVNANKQIVLPDFGTLKGVMTHDGTDLVIDANGKVTLPRYVKGIKDSDGNLLTMDVNDVITLPAPTEKYDNYEIDLSTKDIATDIDANITVPVANITSILKKGATMTTTAFKNDVTANRDLVFIHGLDGTKKTQEAIAYYVSGDANNLVFRVLAIPKAGSGSGAADKEVPEYTRDLHAGDVINHLELITYDNVLYRMIDTAPYTLTGTWATDKTHFEVINSEAKNTYYNLTNDGQMLASWTGSYAEQAPQPLSQSVNAKVVEYSHGGPADVISFNPTTSVWTFRGGDKGRRFEILANLATLGQAAHADAATNGVQVYANWNIAGTTTSVTPAFGQFNNPKEAAGYGGGSGSAFQFDVPAGTEIKIQPALTAYTSDSGKKVWVRSGASNITIKEIGRVVDPVAYLLNDGDAQEMPVGSLIQIMSNSAPKHYLVCDGSAYTIGTYPELEAHFLKEFGSVTHFGAGAAANTYKVPDLRGEFLRMTGTNGHTNAGTGKAEGSGAAVGVHQPATLTQNNAFVGKPSTAGTVAPTLIDHGAVNPDSSSASNGTAPACQGYVNLNGTRYNSDYGTILTSRPTNTSVNVAIKCESTPRVIVDQGTYKVSVPFTITADNSTVTFDVANAEDDTTMVKNSTTLVAPVTGYYAIGTQVNGAGNWLQQMALYITRSNLGVWQSGVGVTGVFKLQAGDEVEFKVSKIDSKPKSGYLNMALVNTVADHKVAEMMQKPNLWTPGVEQSFGDGVYGKRFTGTFNIANGTSNFNISTNFPSLKLENSGGWVEYQANGSTFPVNRGHGGGANFGSGLYVYSTGANPYLLGCNVSAGAGENINNLKYDIWVIYLK